MKDGRGNKVMLDGKELSAKEISILVWSDLVEHGYSKEDSPHYPLIENMRSDCPYCQVLHFYCDSCPVSNYGKILRCGDNQATFQKWADAPTGEKKRYWAKIILKRIEKAPDLLPEEKEEQEVTE